MVDINISIVPSVDCPAGHTELDPTTANPDGSWRPGARFQIRAFRVQTRDGMNWSECTVCKRWFDENGRWETKSH